MGTLLQAHNVAFEHADGASLLAEVSVSLKRGAFVGLVGPNGSGKSTLLRLLAGELEPSEGVVTRAGSVGYLAQDAETSELSGGEATRARLDALVAEDPDVLLLDEPTNHMDAANRAHVAALLARWRGAVLVASHDRALLAGADEIWDLSAGRLKVYGGNYDAYAEMRAVEDAAAEGDAAAAKIALATARAKATEARERQEQRSASAARRAPNMGLPKILLGARKRRAQQTEARLGDVHEKRVDAAVARQREAAAALRPDTTVRLSLPGTAVPAGKVVARLEGIQHGYGDRVLWPEPFSAVVTGPRRIALTGDNGSGKSTLLRILTGELAPASGSASIGVASWAYLDQRLVVLTPGRTVLDLFRDRSPRTSETERRIRLGRLRLLASHVTRPVETLSGGERMRAALALALLGDDPAQLLLLDEPTNHLDLASVETLEAALGGFEGAMIVVSHDARFREALSLEEEWRV